MVLRLPEAPRWAWVAMACAAVAVALLLPRALGTSSSPGSDTRPATVAGSARTPATDPVGILVVGDGWTAGSADGGNGPARWTAVLARELATAGTQVQMTVSASVGSGYLQEDHAGLTFRELALRGARSAPDLLVFVGSESDVAAAEEVRDAAARTYQRVRREWPDARLLVVGPVWPDGSPPEAVTRIGAAIGQAATAAGAHFVDPLVEDWLGRGGGTLIGSEEGYPTDEGHRVLAERIRPELEAVLAGPPQSTRPMGPG